MAPPVKAGSTTIVAAPCAPLSCPRRCASAISPVASGVATGRHLRCEFLVTGRPTNPQRKDAGAGEPVPAKFKSAFDTVRAQLLAELEPTGLAASAPALGSVAGPARDD